MLDNFLNWLTMGGYSLFIWPAYGIVSVGLVVYLLGIHRKRSKIKQKLQQWIKQQSS